LTGAQGAGAGVFSGSQRGAGASAGAGAGAGVVTGAGPRNCVDSDDDADLRRALALSAASSAAEVEDAETFWGEGVRDPPAGDEEMDDDLRRALALSAAAAEKADDRRPWEGHGGAAAVQGGKPSERRRPSPQGPCDLRADTDFGPNGGERDRKPAAPGIPAEVRAWVLQDLRRLDGGDASADSARTALLELLWELEDPGDVHGCVVATLGPAASSFADNLLAFRAVASADRGDTPPASQPSVLPQPAAATGKRGRGRGRGVVLAQVTSQRRAG